MTSTSSASIAQFEEFFKRSLQQHRIKHPNYQVHPEHFRNLALAKWSTLSKPEQEAFKPITMGKVMRIDDSPDNLRKVRTPKRAGKDPNAPKRAKSAYIVFTTTMTKEVRAEHPDWTQGQVMKEAAIRWNQLADKTPYENEAALDKERYIEEKSNYTAPPNQDFLKGKKAKKFKDPNAPKRAKSAYLIFSIEESKRVRAENPQLSMPEVMKQVSQTWKEITDKTIYENEAAADKERYKQEMANFTAED